jgi:hypothetical protein
MTYPANIELRWFRSREDGRSWCVRVLASTLPRAGVVIRTEHENFRIAQCSVSLEVDELVSTGARGGENR